MRLFSTHYYISNAAVYFSVSDPIPRYIISTYYATNIPQIKTKMPIYAILSNLLTPI